MPTRHTLAAVPIVLAIAFALCGCGPSRAEVEKSAEAQRQEIEKRLNDQLNASDKANRKTAEEILRGRAAAVDARTKVIVASLQQASDGSGFQDDLTAVIDRYTNQIADLPNGNEHQWDDIMNDCKRDVLTLMQRYNGKKVTLSGAAAANPEGSEVTLKPASPVGKDLLTGKVQIGPGKWTGVLKEVVGALFSDSSNSAGKSDLLSSRMKALNDAVEEYARGLRRMTVRSGQSNTIQMVVFSDGMTTADINASYEKGIKQKSLARNVGAGIWSLTKAAFSTGDEAAEDIKGDWMTNEALKGRITIELNYRIASTEEAAGSADVADDSVTTGEININAKEWEEGTIFKDYHKEYTGSIVESAASAASDLKGKRVVSARAASQGGIKVIPVGLVPVGR